MESLTPISLTESRTLSTKGNFILFSLGLFLLIATVVYMWHSNAEIIPEIEGPPVQAPATQQESPLTTTKAKLTPKTIANAKQTAKAITAANKPPVSEQEKLTTWHKLSIKRGQSLATIFNQLSIPNEELIALLKLPKAKKLLPKLKPGQELRIQLDNKQHILQLNYDVALNKILMITNINGKYREKVANTPFNNYMRYSGGTIKSNLSVTAQNLGLPHKLIQQLITVFSSRIDFRRDVHPGDSFEVLYQEKYLNGKSVGIGELVAARLNLRGRKHTAIRYTGRTGKVAYFNDQGENLASSFLRFPVHFTRISSPFSRRRWHPILHRYRSHLGVDLAAPRGTPVKAAAEGRVVLRGRDGGYGNTIMLQHGRRYKTVYAHLSRFARRLYVGKYVKRGQIIGYVGSTGLATGPHLHYEFRINNRQYDPVKIKLPNAKSLTKTEMSKFRLYAKDLLAQLHLHRETQLAANNL